MLKVQSLIASGSKANQFVIWSTHVSEGTLSLTAKGDAMTRKGVQELVLGATGTTLWA